MNLSERLGTTLAGDCIRGDFPRVERRMDALNVSRIVSGPIRPKGS